MKTNPRRPCRSCGKPCYGQFCVKCYVQNQRGGKTESEISAFDDRVLRAIGKGRRFSELRKEFPNADKSEISASIARLLKQGRIKRFYTFSNGKECDYAKTRKTK